MKTITQPKSKHRFYLLLLIILCSLHSPALFAQQQIRVTGTVKDTDAPLPGVTVWEKDTNNGTLTDENGKYSLQITPGSIVTFSFIGYKTQTHIVSGTTLNITLQPDEAILDEIVVNAGYYSVKDRERTGSIARVTAKDIEFQPVINPLQAIQGRMAGVNITQQSGVPGGGMHIEIRGQNFLDSSGMSSRNNPLYIIDGVPYSSETLGVGNGNLGSDLFYNGISPLNSINPSDIESIEILKDADATAIYGSRGANGVVLVTTKKGFNDNIKFTLSSAVGFSKVPRFLEVMNTEQFNQMREEAFANDGITEYPPNAYDMNGAWDRNRYTDWQKELIGNTAVNQDISLGIRGGNEYSSFNVNLSHSENTTVFPTDKGYKRNSALLNYNYQSKNNKLSLGIITNYSVQSNDLPAVDLTQQAVTLPPNAPALYNDEGTLNWQQGTWNNPLAALDKTYQNKTETLVLNTNLSYNLLPNIYFRLNTGLTSNALEEWQLAPHTIYNPELGRTSEFSEARNATQNNYSYLAEPQINYIKSFGKHNINLLLGITYERINTSSKVLIGKNYSTNASLKNLSTAKERIIGQIANTEYKYTSLFARFNYTYASKYILNLTARRDGSSRFGNNNRFGNFGAVGAAWIFTEENFLKSSRWLSFGKIRASYGTTGSDNIGDYAYLDSYTVFPLQYNGETSLYPNALFNPDYKWEKTTKFESALELSFIQNRINTSIAYYNNKSNDQLVGLTLPTTTGFSSIISNSPAVVKNYGWEFTLLTENIKTANWHWTTSFNISFPKNKLVSYPGLEEGTQSSFYVIGEPLNIVKTYLYEGMNSETGLYAFKDVNEDGIINYLDQQTVKNLNPVFFGGLQNTFSYKNISLDFLFYFIKKDGYNLNKYYGTPGAAIVNLPAAMTDRWSLTNPQAQYPQATTSNTDITKLSVPFRDSDAAISDASYIRLKNISLSYLIKIPKASIESLKLYIQGQNLWTITNYKGMDPEFTTFGYLPPLKTYAFGVQLTF